MDVIDLTTVPVGPTEFGRWAALNTPLGLDAYGVNLREAAPDEHVEVVHDEADTSQQELFVVISGRARFTVGDETVDAGPGMAVGVGDPALNRGHEALEPGTRVLCIGSTPSGRPEAWGAWIDAGDLL
jgi:uncharacterized cupin superfamily protein